MIDKRIIIFLIMSYMLVLRSALILKYFFYHKQ